MPVVPRPHLQRFATWRRWFAIRLFKSVWRRGSKYGGQQLSLTLERNKIDEQCVGVSLAWSVSHVLEHVQLDTGIPSALLKI